MNKLLKFSRVGCNPCVALGNFLKSEGIQHEELDVDVDLELTAKYGIGSVPTLILVDENGEVLDRVVGFNPPKAEEMASQL
jgi:thioredoxin 1